VFPRRRGITHHLSQQDLVQEPDARTVDSPARLDVLMKGTKCSWSAFLTILILSYSLAATPGVRSAPMSTSRCDAGQTIPTSSNHDHELPTFISCAPVVGPLGGWVPLLHPRLLEGTDVRHAVQCGAQGVADIVVAVGDPPPSAPAIEAVQGLRRE
jgi:hypothetical protein